MSKKDKIDENFLGDLAKNVGIFLAVKVAKGRMPKTVQNDPELKQIWADFEKAQSAAEAAAKKRLAKLPKDRQKRVAKIISQMK